MLLDRDVLFLYNKNYFFIILIIGVLSNYLTNYLEE